MSLLKKFVGDPHRAREDIPSHFYDGDDPLVHAPSRAPQGKDEIRVSTVNTSQGYHHRHKENVVVTDQGGKVIPEHAFRVGSGRTTIESLESILENGEKGDEKETMGGLRGPSLGKVNDNILNNVSLKPSDSLVSSTPLDKGVTSPPLDALPRPDSAVLSPVPSHSPTRFQTTPQDVPRDVLDINGTSLSNSALSTVLDRHGPHMGLTSKNAEFPSHTALAGQGHTHSPIPINLKDKIDLAGIGNDTTDWATTKAGG
ncbi:hypothetical protein TanjilG_12028 [Lupinus angustifolius]|uniref:Uncharacterized protein n=1 Tax=Lupinus angustifolius TaxID=3871 RepID=A0A1J7HAU3_LUPAN|nr:hypothetical protein TanjilG_12028 [Lupinus angustifolius]